MAEKHKRSRKPKVVGTMVVNGKEIPVIGWLDPEKTRKKWRQLSREEAKELEQEFRNLWRETRKVQPFSLLEIFVEQREALRRWRNEG
jgi:hypothetical protein